MVKHRPVSRQRKFMVKVTHGQHAGPLLAGMLLLVTRLRAHALDPADYAKRKFCRFFGICTGPFPAFWTTLMIGGTATLPLSDCRPSLSSVQCHASSLNGKPFLDYW